MQCLRLEEILENRRRVAHRYIERLMTNRYLILPTLSEVTHVSWFVFVVRLNDLFEPGDRDEVMRELRGRGHRLQQLLPADPPPAVHGRDSSATSPATSPSASTSPPARWRCRSSAR